MDAYGFRMGPYLVGLLGALVIVATWRHNHPAEPVPDRTRTR